MTTSTDAQIEERKKPLNEIPAHLILQRVQKLN